MAAGDRNVCTTPTCRNLDKCSSEIPQLKDVRFLFVHTILHEIAHVHGIFDHCIADETAFTLLKNGDILNVVQKVKVENQQLTL